MGLDNKLIFPDFQTLTLDKDNPTAYYTREANGEIYRIDGRSEVISNNLNNVGTFNASTNKYDINITSSKDYTVGNILNKGYPTVIHSTRNYLYVKKIPVTPNKVYSFKRNPFNSQMNIYSFQNNEYGDGTLIKQFYSGYDTGSFTVPNNVEFITIAFLGGKDSINTCYLQEGDEFVDYVQSSTKIISIEQPLRQANNNVYDSIYRFGDGGYYLFKRVGVRSYQDGDYDNPLVITDGVNTNYDLGIADYTEVQLTDFDPSIDFFGTDTTFSCDSMMPSIEVKVPIDYAYNESKRKYVDEEINIDTVDVDSRKNIEIVSIEGQTFENLLQEPLVQGTAINPVELTGRECVYTGGENTTVPLREITGDTYINLLEDKIEKGILKPTVTYTDDVIDGTNTPVLTQSSFILGSMDSETGEYVNANDSIITSDFIAVNKASSITMTVNVNVQIRVYQYDANKKFISSFNPNNTDLVRNLELADNVSFIKLTLATANNNINVSFSSIPYNFNTGDKIVIDKINGNTKVYNEAIPVADYKTNAFCCDLVLQSIDNEGIQDLNKKESLGFSNYIYVKDFNKGIYARVYEKGSTIPKGFGATWYRYDDNLKYIGKSGLAIDDSARPMNIPDTSYIKLVLTNNNEEVEHQEGIYEVVISNTKPTGYIEPTILGYKTFPIQSVGELYVDEQGEPILDDDNNEQYKVDIISSNSLWDGKSWINGRVTGNGVPDGSFITNCTLYEPYGLKFTHTGSSMRGLTLDNITIDPSKYVYMYFNHKGYCNVENSTMGVYGCWFNWYDKDYKYISTLTVSSISPTLTNNNGIKNIDETNTTKSYFIAKNIPSNAKYLRICVLCGDVKNNANIDRILYNIQVVQTELKDLTKPIEKLVETVLLPQPLTSSNTINGSEVNKLVWNNELSKYIIESSVEIRKFDVEFIDSAENHWSGSYRVNLKNNIDISSNSKYEKIFFVDKLPVRFAEYNYIEGGKYIYLSVNSLNECGYTIEKYGSITALTKQYFLDNPTYYYFVSKNSKIIETNITKKITLPCYDSSTYIYTSGTSSHDNTNHPPLEELKGEITCTTLPLSTTAYIKPNTKYTMFMDTDCKVNYNLGGMDGDLGIKEHRLDWKENITLDPDTALEVSNATYSTTNFFSINKSIYRLTRGTGSFGAVYKYNSNKEFIERIVLTNIRNLDIDFRNDPNVKFIRIVEEKSWYNNLKLNELISYSNGKFVKVLTTPSTLSNNTLTLLGEGNIGNVTLLEGDYTNSYVPDTFINDVFSVGELQEDGSYKVDIVSKNKNLFVLSMDSIYDTFYFYNKVSKEDAVVIDNEEKTITFNGTDATQGIKVKNRLKKGHTYTIRFKIKWNSGRAGYGIPFVNLVDSLGRKNPNEDSSRLSYSLGIDQNNVYVEICKTFTLDTDRYLYLQMTTGNRSSSSMTIKDLEIIEGDIIDAKYSEGKEDIISISLPQPLRRVGDVCDRFYWDKTRRKMCIEKNVVEIDFSIFDFSPCPYISGKFQITVPNMITGEGSLICNSIKAYGTNHGDLHGDTTDSNGYIVGAVAVGSDKHIILRLGKGMTKDDSIQWLINHNTKIYHRIFPEIIETDITEPIEIDIFDTDTTITTTSTVNPNMYLKSDILSRPVTIKPSTKYYVYANTTGDIEVSLGGAKIQYTSSDIVKEITTPSNISENIIGFVGDCEVSNVMLRTDNRTDIKYFNGVIYASILQDDGNYKTTINIMSNNSEEYDSFINIITSSPLESGSKIVVVDNEFKLLKANGEYEDIVSTDGNVVIDSNCKKICSCGEVNGITSLIVPYRSVRPLKAPINISFNNYTDNDNHTFIWDTDVGVEGHKFYYKDELVATIENPDPTYTYPSEMEGDVKIVAFNTLTESEGAVKDIVTLPNRSEVVALNTIYDNGYKFTIDFNDNSNIRKGYKFIYSVDDGEENIIDIPVSDKAITLSQNIDVSEVSNNMKVRINSYNSVGEAEMKEKIFYLTPTPKWAYLLSSDNLMFRHQDKFPFTTYYKIKATNTQTLEENEYSYGSNQGINGLIIDYLLKSNREEELSVMLTMNDGYLDHVPCVPFKVSKTLDLSLVAPQNFTMEWVGDGVAKFSWDDNYTNEDYFEFVYSLNGGIEEVVRIYPEDVAGTGGRISYTYEFDGFGILTGRVRMVWELNTSEYTDSKTATFVAVTGLPPAWIVKEYSGDNLVITWEAQSYVDHYEIMIECDGEVEILTEKKDMFYLDLKKYHGKYVSISIKTHFTTGLVTEYSDSILFKPVSTSGITNQMTYAPIKVEKDDNVSVYTKLADGYTSYQRITGLITNSNLLYNKFCKDMLTNSASFNNVFYHLVNHEYKDFVSVKTDNVSIESLIRILNYAHINQDGHLNTFVYTPITSSHTDFVDIQKVTIVCIGDSITSGHPGFWE